MDVSEMKMLRWMSGYTLKDRIRNDHSRERVEVAPISEKMREYRLRWYGHVQRRELDEPVIKNSGADGKGAVYKKLRETKENS